MVELVPVHPALVARAWTPAVEDIVERVAAKAPAGPISSAEARAACMAGEWQLWLGIERGETVAVAVTGIIHEPGRRVCVWLITGGSDMAAWGHLRTPVEIWARQQGCSAMRSISRPGMARRLPEYRPRGVILERPL